MSAENLDDKIKETLNQENTAYDESSWLKMQALLDKHLPEKKDDRKRFILFMIFFLLLGSGITLLITGEFSQKKKAALTQKPIIHETFQSDIPSSNSLNNENHPIQSKSSKEDIENKVEKNTIEPIIDEAGDKQLSVNKKNVFDRSNNTTINNQFAIPQNKLYSEKNIANKKSGFITQQNSKVRTTEKNVIMSENSSIEINTMVDKTNLPKSENQNIIDEKEAPVEKNITSGEKSGDELSTTHDSPVSDLKKNNSIPKSSFIKNIFIIASAGPDLSVVGSNTGTIKFTTGGGIGYKISNRFSISTGIYSGRKIYTANPVDYHPPANFWNYYPNLKHIDANCKILDVPLTISYNYIKSKNISWFFSAGVSSLFMKTEKYNYYYKPTNSQQYIYYSRSYKDVNKHYFSILNLSGGFSRKINNHFSLQAEPYIKIAMKGVGYGKVKLNSSGILFSAIVNPFR